MSVITRIITKDWYAGASLYYTVYDGSGSVLQARTAMTENPSGSGCFYANDAAWDTSWVGRVVYDDGSIFESEEIAPPANATSVNSSNTAAAYLAATTPTVTTCHTAGGTQSAPILTNDLNFPVPSGLGAGWVASYFGQQLPVLSYNSGTMTVTVDGTFSTPVEGGHDISFWRESSLNTGSSGVGEFPIDHNGGSGTAGADCTFYLPYSNGSGVGSTANLLKFTSDGTTGVASLSINAYLASDYDLGLRNSLGSTTTGSDGTWSGPINLDSGTYYLVADRPGDAYQAYQVKVVVP